MKTKYAFLVRTETDVMVTFKLPTDVKIISARTWCVWKNGRRSFEYTEHIGDNHGRFLCSDSYTGTIGVFDISKPSHVKILAETIVQHRLEQIGQDLQSGLEEVFGQKTVDEVSAEPHVRNHSGRSSWRKLSKSAGLYSAADTAVRRICFA